MLHRPDGGPGMKPSTARAPATARDSERFLPVPRGHGYHEAMADPASSGSSPGCPFAGSSWSLGPVVGVPQNVEPEIVAYSAWGFGIEVVPAYKRREWMDHAARGFPYACLPMSIANMSGWFVLAPHGCIAKWNGGSAPGDMIVSIPDPPPPPPTSGKGGTWSKAPPGVQAQSAVGHGILTWTLGYVFRTPPGWNMLCRGPANVVKDGIAPLEGLVESDWTNSSFSMNWKFTRPGTVSFEKGEPIAMLVPQRRGELEVFRCRKADFSANPELAAGYRTWIESRVSFLDKQRSGDQAALKQRFEKHYMHGTTTEGHPGPQDHQMMRELSRFQEPGDEAAPAQ